HPGGPAIDAQRCVTSDSNHFRLNGNAFGNNALSPSCKPCRSPQESSTKGQEKEAERTANQWPQIPFGKTAHDRSFGLAWPVKHRHAVVYLVHRRAHADRAGKLDCSTIGFKTHHGTGRATRPCPAPNIADDNAFRSLTKSCNHQRSQEDHSSEANERYSPI